MTKIVFLDRETIGPTVKINRPAASHEWVEYQATSAEQIVERIRGAHIVITNKVPLREETLKLAPTVKAIVIAATGYDVIDVAYCKSAGISVSNVRGYAINTVPEHTMALLLALRRNIIGYRQDVIDGEWQKSGNFCFFTHSIKDLSGYRMGIIGEGVIGQGVARLARAFGLDVVFAAHKGVEGLGPLYMPWDEVLETCDIISLHSPLMPATRNMISHKEFDQMKQRPLILNTSRGGLVDERALVDALKAGKISGAGFDVLTSEPPQPDNPLLEIVDLPNVIVTPHVAWASQEAMQTLWDQVVSMVDGHISGSAFNLLT